MIAMVIVIDTREQLPYDFGDIETVTKKLESGDYSVVGFEDRIAIERKSLEDLIGTFIKRRVAFYRELERLQEYDHACIVVEGSLKDIYDKKYISSISPLAVVGTIMHILIEMKIPVYFCYNRQITREFVIQYLMKARRYLGNESVGDKI